MKEIDSKTTQPKIKQKPVAKPQKKTPALEKIQPVDDTQRMKLGGSHNLVGKILLGLILFILAFFFIRTAIWEYNYYREKEGSPRATANTVETTTTIEELDETEVTEEERTEYTVAADAPRYLSIEKLSIRNARILPMGVKGNGELDTPNNIFDVGWYNQSSKPGAGGVLVIDGHNGGPNIQGVFKNLNQLYAGDKIVIERGDGQKFVYKVVENNEVPLSEADDYMITAFQSPTPGKEALTLISCIGEWSQVQQTYLSRQFTRAVLE